MRIQKVSNLVLYVLLIISLIVLGVFYFGGETPVENRLVADTSMSEPAHTSTLIVWMYILLIATIAVTVIAALYNFVKEFIDSPKKAIRSLIGIILLVLLLIVTYAMGSGEKLNLIGYDGTENVPFWLKLTDMFLYTIYVLMAILVLLIIGFAIRKKIKG